MSGNAGLQEAGAGVHAAVLLARGRAEGAGLVANDRLVAARSFWAMALCLPAFACLRLMDWIEGGLPARPAHALATGLAAYALGWLAFAVVSHPLAGVLGQAARWPRFIALWNWCNFVQFTLAVAAGLPGLLGAPEVVSETAALAVFGWALWLEWFAARLTLGLAPLAAGVLVMTDILLEQFVASAVYDLSAALG